MKGQGYIYVKPFSNDEDNHEEYDYLAIMAIFDWMKDGIPTTESEIEKRQKIQLQNYENLVRHQLENYNQLKTRTVSLLTVLIGFIYFVFKDVFAGNGESLCMTLYNFVMVDIIVVLLVLSIIYSILILWSRSYFVFPEIDNDAFQNTQYKLEEFLNQILDEYRKTHKINKEIFETLHQYFNATLICFSLCIMLTFILYFKKLFF